MTAGGATATEETALLKERDPEEALGHLEKLDLTNLSFVEQLSSGVYIRLSIFFLVTSFWANFYIATVTTEVWLFMENTSLCHSSKLFLTSYINPYSLETNSCSMRMNNIC